MRDRSDAASRRAGGFATRFPDRTFDVGTAEQHADTFALLPRFLPHASRDQILRAHGLDAAGITTTVLTRLASTCQGKAHSKEI